MQFKQPGLQVVIGLIAGGQRRRGVHLEQPQFQIVVQQDVVSVQFEAVLVVYNVLLHALQAEIAELNFYLVLKVFFLVFTRKTA